MKNEYLNNGFTLIELMMTLVIFAVLVSIAVPSFNTLIQNKELVAQLSNLNSTLAYARSEAIARTETIGICPSSDGANCGSTMDWADGWIVYVESDGTVLRREEGLEGEVTLTGSAASGIKYNSDGELDGAAGFELVMCGGNAQSAGDTQHSKTISIGAVGSARVKAGTASCP